ncbi:MAG: hypothetical protein QOJ64_949 [Acidobacteriota bacterium]|nr:hypothetical protein [Acidobacteriota bacterium]
MVSGRWSVPGSRSRSRGRRQEQEATFTMIRLYSCDTPVINLSYRLPLTARNIPAWCAPAVPVARLQFE